MERETTLARISKVLNKELKKIAVEEDLTIRDLIEKAVKKEYGIKENKG